MKWQLQSQYHIQKKPQTPLHSFLNVLFNSILLVEQSLNSTSQQTGFATKTTNHRLLLIQQEDNIK